MATHYSWSLLLMWINIISVLCLAGYGQCFKIPLRDESSIEPSISTSEIPIRPTNSTISSPTNASPVASVSSTTTVTVTSTLHSTLSKPFSSMPVAASATSTALKDLRPTLDEEPKGSQNPAKEKTLSRVPRNDDSPTLENTVDETEEQGEIPKLNSNLPGDTTTQRTRKRQKIKQHTNRRGRKKNKDTVKTKTVIDDVESGDSESTETPFEVQPTARPRGKKNQRRLNRDKNLDERRIRHARRKMDADGTERLVRRNKHKTTETVASTTEIPPKIQRKRDVKRVKVDRHRDVEEVPEEDESTQPEDDPEEDDYDDSDKYDDYDEDYDEYDKIGTEPSVTSKVKRTVLPEVISKSQNKKASVVDDEYDDDSVDDEENADDYDDDEEGGDDYDYDEDADSSSTEAYYGSNTGDEEAEYEQGDGSDVTQRPTNRRARFSDTRQRSADVTAGSTNGRAASLITDSDVGDPRDGVGGKSMNEFLVARMRNAVPARLSAMGSCHLDDLRLVVQCGERLMSVCAGSPDHPTLKVLLENSDGGALLDSNTTVAYGLLRPLPSGRRWLVTDRPTKGVLESAYEPGITDVPVLRVQSGKRICRFLVNCSRSISPNEAWHSLPPAPLLPPCTRSPALHARMLVTSENGSEILQGTKINLGAKVLMRVEAEADLTGSSLEWTETSSGTSVEDGDEDDESIANQPKLDLHLSRCWVGDKEADKASLVEDGCSIVDILTNFVEETEIASTFSIIPPTSESIYNPSRWPLLKRSYKESSTENFTPKESGNGGAMTASKFPALTRRVVQSAELITFVLDLSDKKINLSCNVEVCVGQCRTAPSCVTSSVNTGNPAPPVYSKILTLTTTITPDTGVDEEGPSTEPSIEESPTSPQPESTLPSTAKEEDPDLQKRHPRSTAIDSAKSSNTTNMTKPIALPLELEKSGLKSREQPVMFSECVPWWVFLLSITVLSMVYIVALFGCVYMTNHTNRDYTPVECQAIHTPVRSNFPDQSSARKRTPQACPEKYLYC